MASRRPPKGVILAGGLGKRLSPLTDITNKHLLPIYNQPMIFYPLQLLADAGIKDVIIVTGGNSPGDFLRLIGHGGQFGLRQVHYAYQKGEGGIADALKSAEYFVGDDRMVVVLGDNIVLGSIRPHVEAYQAQPEGAKILLQKVKDPGRFGVAEVAGGKVCGIVEKPRKPKSNLIVTGIYMYDAQVFDIIRTLKPSRRGELEITDVNNAYIQKSTLTYSTLKHKWMDCGTFESMFEASRMVRKQQGDA